MAGAVVVESGDRSSMSVMAESAHIDTGRFDDDDDDDDDNDDDADDISASVLVTSWPHAPSTSRASFVDHRVMTRMGSFFMFLYCMTMDLKRRMSSLRARVYGGVHVHVVVDALVRVHSCECMP